MASLVNRPVCIAGSYSAVPVSIAGSYSAVSDCIIGSYCVVPVCIAGSHRPILSVLPVLTTLFPSVGIADSYRVAPVCIVGSYRAVPVSIFPVLTALFLVVLPVLPCTVGSSGCDERSS